MGAWVEWVEAGPATPPHPAASVVCTTGPALQPHSAALVVLMVLPVEVGEPLVLAG